VRLLENQTTRDLLEAENKALTITDFSNNPGKTLLEEIYEITNSTLKMSLLNLKVISLAQIKNLNFSFNQRLKNPNYIELKEILESGDMALVEDLLMPSELREWLRTREIEDGQRVEDLRNYINMIDQMENITTIFDEITI
jgi:hypothetical protein